MYFPYVQYLMLNIVSLLPTLHTKITILGSTDVGQRWDEKGETDCGTLTDIKYYDISNELNEWRMNECECEWRKADEKEWNEEWQGHFMF